MSDPERVCVGQVIVCGLLSSCRKDFTSPGDYEDAFVTARHSKTKQNKGLSIEATGEVRLGCLSCWEVREKGTLETGSEN